MKPNYIDLGYSDKMVPKLRKLVEKQLCDDLKIYGNMCFKYETELLNMNISIN